MALYLHPISAPRRVVTIRFLCHHALQCVQQCEPLLRQCEVARLRHQLQAGVQAREEILESLASVTQRQLRERYTAQLEHIEDEKDRGSLPRCFPAVRLATVGRCCRAPKSAWPDSSAMTISPSSSVP